MEKKTECKKEIKILLTNRKGQDIIKFHREETSGGRNKRNKKSIKKVLTKYNRRAIISELRLMRPTKRTLTIKQQCSPEDSKKKIQRTVWKQTT